MLVGVVRGGVGEQRNKGQRHKKGTASSLQKESLLESLIPQDGNELVMSLFTTMTFSNVLFHSVITNLPVYLTFEKFESSNVFSLGPSRERVAYETSAKWN